jgi:hypothetical protein
MAINRNGFELTNTGLVIDKDTQAQLTYTFDWSSWLDAGDSLDTVEFTVVARRNDPTPIVIEAAGKADSNSDTYVELSGGQADKTYIVTCKIVTANGLIDRRAFRVNVLDRQA